MLRSNEISAYANAIKKNEINVRQGDDVKYKNVEKVEYDEELLKRTEW